MQTSGDQPVSPASPSKPPTTTASTSPDAPLGAGGSGGGGARGGGGGRARGRGGGARGGGGQEPARTELTLTATSTGVSPARAGVAPYISVRVTLVSKDGSAHRLAIGGKALAVGGARRSAAVTLPGLRPGGTYTGRDSSGTTVRILSTAEPGP